MFSPFALISAKRMGWRIRRSGGVAASEMSASRAKSRGDAPGWCGRLGWRAGLPPSPEGLDNDHAPAAAGTRREVIEWLWIPQAPTAARRQAARGHAQYWPCVLNWQASRNTGCGESRVARHGSLNVGAQARPSCRGRVGLQELAARLAPVRRLAACIRFWSGWPASSPPRPAGTLVES